MSLIYAHKTFFGTRVLSDTKPSIDANDIDRLKKRFTKEEFNNFIKYGVVKTVIYKPNITISSAGMLEHFNKLLGYLETNNITNIEDILKAATDIHNRYDKDTDFIITTEYDIYEIKDGKYEKVEFSWIGDSDAFSRFQEQKSNFAFDERSCSTKDFTKEEIDAFKEKDKIDFAFQKVIDDETIDSVGGILVICYTVKSDNYEYWFESKYATFSGFNYKQILKPGNGIIFSHEISDGGFEYFVLESKTNFSIYLNQVKLGIAYDKGYSDSEYCNLMLPHPIHCDYNEFADKYQVKYYYDN